jgi:hypothetical protein
MSVSRRFDTLASRRRYGPSLHARRTVLAAALALVLAVAAEVVAPAQQRKPLDYEVKAVYLLNFGRFATWPSSAPVRTDVFPVCVLGQDPFGRALDAAVSSETINGQMVVARRLDRPEDAAACRVLFISASEQARVRQILAVVSRAPTLTVSDAPQFVEQDGMIQFVAEGNKVRFAVNVSAAERAGLSLSSELLRVAVSVKTRSRP